jgi:PAS domain S-box-containing protein
MVKLDKNREKQLVNAGELIQDGISQHERALAAAQAAERKYQRIFENAVEGIYQTTPEGQFLTVNPALARMLGYGSPGELMENLNDISNQLYVRPGRREEFIRKIKSEGFVAGFAAEVYRKDGTIAVISINARAVTDQEGNLLHFEGFIEDITESKRLEKELQQAQKMEAVGTLAGGIAHDFNNLLQGILGYSEIILRKKEEDHPDHRRLREIQKLAQRASELTQQLLTFSRKVESILRPVDLNQEVMQVHKLLKRTIPKMINIELHLQKDLRVINADPAQMEQIMMNLAVNARDAMPGGGTLVFETENVVLEEGELKNRTWAQPGKYVLLTISDTGQGMDRETMEHIFEPFFTTKEVGKGTGLGLAMVYGIVKAHGGHIACYSEPEKGTTFQIFLPAEGELKKEMQSAAEGNREIPGGSETVLLVDDEAILRDLGREILTNYGYTVLLAPDGKKALEICRERGREISLVILDLIMPGTGGKNCLEKLLLMDPEIRVVIASGYSVNWDKNEALEAGAKGFIRKPYEIKQMLEVLRQAIDG